ncbi:MAG: hypothetical protein K5Q68_21780 [Roseococcus sp.]|nr:hypothetical protein [Roseococcus sp.]
MRKLLPVLALTGLLGFTACTDAYGRYDPVATGFLAAGAAVAAVAVGVAASQPSRSSHYGRSHYGRSHYGRSYYGRPAYHSGFGYGPPRRAHW